MNEIHPQDKRQDPKGEWLELGDGLRAYYARPDGSGPFPAILIYIEAFGLNEHFKRLTERFAGAGFVAVTPDLYDGAIYEYANLPGAVAHLKTLRDETVLAQTERTLDAISRRPEVAGRAIGVTGFCMGGRYAFLASAALPSRFKAAVAYYGGGIAPLQDRFGRPTLLDRVGQIEAPLLLWYGAEDQFIRPDEHGRLAEALGQAGKQYTLTVFAKVTHGFFCDDRGSYDRGAAERSWRATTAFFHEYLNP